MIPIILIMTGILWITFVMLSGWVHRFRKGRLSAKMIIFVKAFGLFFVAYDVLFNVTVGTILFLQIPNPDRLTLTERLKDILRHPPTRGFQLDKGGTYIPAYRFSLAFLMCKYLIEPHDKGHCS